MAFLTNIAPDKLAHQIAGAIVALVVAAVLLLLKRPELVGKASMVAACLAGLVREAYNAWQNHQQVRRGLLPTHGVELADLLHTSLGGWYVAFPWLLLVLVATYG